MTQVYLYDTTLRDGMGGQGMSLSAAEKVRVVHALDRLGVHLIEAGFPLLEPEGGRAVRDLAGEESAGADLRVRDDPPQGRERRGRSRAARPRSCFAPICTPVGKTWALHLEKVTRVSREENRR